MIKLYIKMYWPVFNCFFTNLMALTMTIFQNLHLGNILIRPVGYINVLHKNPTAVTHILTIAQKVPCDSNILSRKKKDVSENKMQCLIYLQSKCHAVILALQSWNRKFNFPNSYLGTQTWEKARGQHEGHHKIIPASVGLDIPVG